MPEAIERSTRLKMQPQLWDHMRIDNSRLPSRTVIYDARINFDMASMLYSRDFILTSPNSKSGRHQLYCLHLRSDPSPQFGRDYQVTQADIVHPGTCWSTTQITKRLLPIQNVGSRASTAAYKLQKVIFSLGLESHNVAYTASQVCSIMVDSGTESALWLTPEPGQSQQSDASFFFGKSMPLPDADHLLHHVMGCIHNWFDWHCHVTFASYKV